MSGRVELDPQWLIERTRRATQPTVGSNFLDGGNILADPIASADYAHAEPSERRRLEVMRRRAPRYVIRKARDDADRDLLIDMCGLTYEDAAPLPSPGFEEAQVEPATTWFAKTTPVELRRVRPGWKVCTCCGVSKVLTDFAVRAGASDGRTSHCKACRGRNDAKRKADLKTKAAEAAAARGEVAA